MDKFSYFGVEFCPSEESIFAIASSVTASMMKLSANGKVLASHFQESISHQAILELIRTVMTCGKKFLLSCEDYVNYNPSIAILTKDEFTGLIRNSLQVRTIL